MSNQFNNQPLVSVIMNCYNGEAYLYESIKSVLSQTYANWELIFWDNRSNDKSAEIYVEQIKEAIVSGKISTVNAAVSLPVSSAIIKVIQAPLMTDDEIERAIEHESLWQNLIQLQDELDSYSIFYQVILNLINEKLSRI